MKTAAKLAGPACPVLESASQFLAHIRARSGRDSASPVEGNFDSARFTAAQKEAFLKTCPAYRDFVEKNFEGLFETYTGLANESSRALFVNLILYRMLGPDHVRIQDGWTLATVLSFEERLGVYQAGDSRLDFKRRGNRLCHFENIPFASEVFAIDTGAKCRFIFSGQYFYEGGADTVRVRRGDVVIDAGSCMGEATVKFVLAAGTEGFVYAFDPLPAHHEVLAHNLAQNNLSARVEVVQFGLYDRCQDGAGGKRAHDIRPDFSLEGADVPTVTLDHFARERNLERLDFIKMDIEGAELAALRGGAETLKRFKPKLAISLYHRPEDYVEIPRFLRALCPGYRFFLGHYSLHGSETVLYALHAVDK